MAGTPRASSRDAILRVFAELVARKGYSDTSLSEVAGTLGLSKGTIVHHFGSKDQLLTEVHEAYYLRRSAELEYIQRELDGPLVQLPAVIYALIAAHRDDRDATLTFLREFVRYSSTLSEDQRQRRYEFTEALVKIIERGVGDGVFRNEDPRLTALHIFGMCNYAWTWYRPEGRLSAEDIATTFAREILLGLWSGHEDKRAEVDRAIAEAIKAVKAVPGRFPPPAA